MSSILKFEDIEAWKKARLLTKSVYDVTRQSPLCRDFGLCDQIRRACVSVMSNIAEGFERDGNSEFRHFLAIAKGSAAEVRSQLYVLLDAEYIDQAVFDELNKLTWDTIRLIGGFMRYLENTDLRGKKFAN